nr:hypothetical protein [Actinomycetota bacterium]
MSASAFTATIRLEPDMESAAISGRRVSPRLGSNTGRDREVQLMLGHSDPAITLRRYTGVLDSMKAAAEAALDRMFQEASPPKSGEVVEFGSLSG